MMPSSPNMTAVRMEWKARSGTQLVGPWVEHEDYQTALSGARQAARMHGWPGHAGGWWNYFVDDLSGWLHRHGVGNALGLGRES